MTTNCFMQEQVGDVIVVRLNGRVDTSAVQQIKDEFRGVEAKIVLVNLQDVTFLDSSGLGLIVSNLRRLRENGADLRLCCLPPQVQTIFELTKLHQVFDIYTTEEIALAACQ